MVRDTETNLVRLPSSRGSHTKDPCQGVTEENLIQDCLPAGNSQYHNVWINFPPSGTELRRLSSGDRDKFCKAAQEANNTEDPRPELSQKEGEAWWRMRVLCCGDRKAPALFLPRNKSHLRLLQQGGQQH